MLIWETYLVRSIGPLLLNAAGLHCFLLMALLLTGSLATLNCENSILIMIETHHGVMRLGQLVLTTIRGSVVFVTKVMKVPLLLPITTPTVSILTALASAVELLFVKI